MSKISEKQAQPDCVLCGVVFFGNPLDMQAERYLQPSGRWDWICMTCLGLRKAFDKRLHHISAEWMPLGEGKKCDRCNAVVDSWAVANAKYRWIPGSYDWEFHCLKCFLEYQRQQLAFPCSVKLLHCEECLYVIRADDARSAGWQVVPETGEAWCFFCKLGADPEAGDAVPLSCTSIPQEKSRVDNIGRLELRWVILLTQILTLAAIGLNWQFFILLLASASTVMVTVKQFARGNELKELLEKKKVQT